MVVALARPRMARKMMTVIGKGVDPTVQDVDGLFNEGRFGTATLEDFEYNMAFIEPVCAPSWETAGQAEQIADAHLSRLFRQEQAGCYPYHLEYEECELPDHRRFFVVRALPAA
ncbi:MAG: hypothetical protein H6684_07980 [Deltaproteobacteria bacterium]|nr:hypothetical protein [bacterium]MCB9476102.1 hypothetical protein [Deltaproteobacteria bacterium]MCB9488653.1 hypothetical protein [Deltaproteobacteria bacterium]